MFRNITFKQIDLQKLPYQKMIILVLAIICIVSVRSCSLKQMEITSSGIKIEMYKAQANVFNTTVNKLGETITTQLAVITNKDKEVEKLLSKNSTLSNLNTQMKFSSEAKVYDVVAAYAVPPETIRIHDTTYIPVGTDFSKTDKWYSISGSIQDKGVVFDSLSFKDSITYNLGTKRQPGLFGFFKPYDPTVEVISSNPYITVKSLQNMKFVSKPKWYERKGVWFIAGAVSAGVGAYYLVK